MLVSADSEHFFWYLTRASGFVAYLLLFFTVAFGLIMSINLVGRRMPRSTAYDMHRFLALLTLGFTVFHIVIVLPDGYVDFSLKHLLIPLASPYRPFYTALGTIGFYLMVAVIISFYLRNQLGYRTWRAFHYVTFLLFLTALGHSVGAGTDTSAVWAQEIYLLSVIFLAGLALLRLFERQRRA